MPYEDDPRFEGYFFEESYVLEIQIDQCHVEFKLQLVLTPKHPLYKAPAAGTSYCYRNGILSFRNIQKKKIENLDLTPTFDPDGSKDFGNIDCFSENPKDHYELSGSWGKMTLFALDVGVEVDTAAM